jgi:PleD family two-component response regulator
MSIGVAVRTVGKLETIEQLVERADAALCRAKKEGRKRIVFSAG